MSESDLVARVEGHADDVLVERLRGLLGQTSLTLYESKEVFVGAALLIAERAALLADNERLTTQLELRDQACTLGGEEVRRQKVRAAAAEARLARVTERLQALHRPVHDHVADELGLSPYPGDICAECAADWPCPTIAAASVVSETGEKP